MRLVSTVRGWGFAVLAGGCLLFMVSGGTGGGFAVAQEVLTNETVVNMVRGGLPATVIVQKIRSSQRKFDTSTEALIQLKAAGVPDSVIEAMTAELSPEAPKSGVAAVQLEPTIAHVGAAGEKMLKSIYGVMEIKVEPFAGRRQEVVLPTPRAEYRMTDKAPTFSTPQTVEQWILTRLKPGKKDRNLPMNKSDGWYPYSGYATRSYQHGVDPKYVVKLAAEPGPNGGTRLKPLEPLTPGEYGFVAVVRGQPNLVEVFDFGID